jgi:putative Mn2+ efflux pump MntP
LTIWELLLTALALSMDALAAAAATGALLEKVTVSQAVRVGAWFGLFQGLMPVIGIIAGQGLHECLLALEHWVAFGLLAAIGGRMIWEDIRPGAEFSGEGDPLAVGRLFMLAVATSLDALAVGVSLAMTGGFEPTHGLVIGCTTFSLCVPAVLMGEKLNRLMKRRAGLFSGAVLFLIGVKILLEHLIWGI